MKRLVHTALLWLAQNLGIRQAPGTLARQAQAYWSDPGAEGFTLNAHWKDGMNPVAWDQLGREHFQLYQSFCGLLGRPTRVRSMMEWGCGGGCNAVHFARECDVFFGVDVAEPTLEECQKQLRESKNARFVPVLVPTDAPEAAEPKIDPRCDFFLSTFVFELLPTREIGQRILQTARRCLRDDGIAIIQIKYQTTSIRTRTRRWGYRRNLANMTSWRIEEFWELCQRVGFHPRFVKLVPEQPLIHDERYAYFLLTVAP